MEGEIHGGDLRTSKQQHFVLVHGVGHGAWCWYKVLHLLESSGHKVSCIDLASAGIDRSDPNSILSFEEYDKPLLNFMSVLPEDEKVVLVGHSAGGLSLIHIMHEFAEKISVAIFVAATMLRSGFLSEDDIRDGVPNLSEYGDVYELNFGLGTDNPPTSATLQKEFQFKILYQLSPAEDSKLASMLLRPWPVLALQNARFEGAEENVDQVRRVFIRTTHDNMVKAEQQDAMIRKWPPNDVFSMKTDHSPFFSGPEELCTLFIKASTLNFTSRSTGFCLCLLRRHLNQKLLVILVLLPLFLLRERCDEVAEALLAEDLHAVALHGGRSQNEREAALRDFRKGSINILVATDVASRGLDVTGVAHVINLDLPKAMEDYVHRIGRTGRAGSIGQATSFYTDRDMFLVAHIRKAIADVESGNTVEIATGKVARRKEREAAAAHREAGTELSNLLVNGSASINIEDRYRYMVTSTPLGKEGSADDAWDD